MNSPRDNRRMDGLFSDASQKRLEEERFCYASLTRRFDRGRPLVLAAALLAAIGCNSASSEQPSSQPKETSTSTLSVPVITPQRTSLHRKVTQPGAIQAFEETPVFAMVSGYVKEGWKDIGAQLTMGEALAELYAPQLEDELRQKEALVDQAVVAIEQSRAAEKAAEAAYKSAVTQVEVAEANRQMLLARQKRTHSQFARLERAGSTVLDKENIEEAQLGYETARAGVAEAEAKIKTAKALRDEARAKWSKATADVKAAKVYLRVAERNRDYARDMVGYLRLRAPYDCVVVKRNVVTDYKVDPANADKGKPLYVVHRRDLLRIVVQVPETDTIWVKKGADALVQVPKLPGRTFTGQVARTASSVDPATRTLRAEIDLPTSAGPLRPGMYAYATLSADVPDLLTLPRSAVITEGDVTRGYQTYCYQVEDGKVRRLLIQTGMSGEERIEVLKKQAPAEKKGAAPRWVDFTGDEQIVAAGVKKLSSGQAVTVAPKK